MNDMVHVLSTLGRIKNQPSNSTFCIDNALRLLVPVAGRSYRGLQVTSSFSLRSCVLKGCFERGIFGMAKSRLEGIEDSNLERWVQLVTCCDLLFLLQFIGGVLHSIDSSQTMGDRSSSSLELQPAISQTSPIHLVTSDWFSPCSLSRCLNT